jgi:hypothetical protein
MASTPFDAAADLYPDTASICDWAVEQCHLTDLATQKCQRGGCSKYLHHICSIQWETKNNIPEGNIASLCRAHHPHYQKYVAAAAAIASTASKNNITGGVNLTSPVAAAAADTSDRSSDDDYDDDDVAAAPLSSPAEQHYVEKCRTMLSLATMCIGALDDDGLALIDPNAMPWNKLPKKQIKPASDLLRVEINRRWENTLPEGGKEPATKNWDKNKLIKWLEEHPIAAADDVAFLKCEVASRKRTAINAAMENDKEAGQRLDLDGATKNKYKSWSGRVPYLRLIHALLDHDNIKTAYVRRGDISSGRMAVENRNTDEAKAASVWQMMADKWNDENFAPATACEPDWHFHYTSSETITFAMVSEFLPPDAKKVKDRFESMLTLMK